MSKLAVVCCVLFAACAAGTVGVDRETAPHAAPRIEMIARTSSARVFPVAKDPQLPSADRVSRLIRNELGGVASADVRLCVSPNGRVDQVQIVRGSSLFEFDQALLRDVPTWQFSELPGTSAAGLRTCEITTISYRSHS